MRTSLLGRTVGVVLTALAVVMTVAPTASADSLRAHEWHLDELGLPAAQKITKGAGVVVAVVDSGVAASHRALVGQVLPGTNVTVAGDGDGRTDTDPHGHGTAMAALIVGSGKGRNNMLGVAPEAKVLPIVAGTKDNISASDVVAGVRWAVDHGARVINLSLGAAGRAPDSEFAAVKYAMDHDVVVVAASGNKQAGGPAVNSPGNVPGVIAVTGTVRGGEPWSGSSIGPETVLAAPAEKVTTITPGSGTYEYAVVSGTSAAAAIVSGVAALVRAHFPDMDAANVVNRLVATARDVGASGRNDTTGFGMVDPMAALSADVAPVTRNPLLPAALPSTTTRAPRQQVVGSAPSDTGSGILVGSTMVLLLVGGAILLLRQRFLRRGTSVPRPAQYPHGQPVSGPLGYGYGPPGVGQEGSAGLLPVYPPGYRPVSSLPAYPAPRPAPAPDPVEPAALVGPEPQNGFWRHPNTPA